MIVRDSNVIAALTVIAEDLHTRPEDPINDLHMRDLLVEYLRQNWPNTQLQEHHMDHANLLALRIRDALVEDEFYAIPVNERYFAKKQQAELHGETWPHNEDQARRSLARGSAKAVGLHFHTGADDLLFEAYVLSHTREGASKYAKNINRIIDAMDNGTITVPRAGRIIRAGQRRLVIENVDAIRKALDMAEDDEQPAIEG